MNAVVRAERAVAEARDAVVIAACDGLVLTPTLDALVRAVEARCAERILATLPDKLPCNCYGCDECGKHDAAGLIRPNSQETP